MHIKTIIKFNRNRPFSLSIIHKAVEEALLIDSSKCIKSSQFETTKIIEKIKNGSS